ncbi:MAG: glycogen-debranching protein [Myxococcales bacterium]|nr:glycogen-debranching protein [Myxococcales bacterium]
MRRTLVLVQIASALGCGGSGLAPEDAAREAGADATIEDATIEDAAARDTDVADAGLDAAVADPWSSGPPLGARRRDDGDVELRVRAPRATRIEVAFFAAAWGESERLRVPMVPDPDGETFALEVEGAALRAAGVDATVYYGLRVWGPNWPYDPAWTPGSELGRLADVDDDGNRMNPNKLLLDPYALEVSHDPITPEVRDFGVYRTDATNRSRDSGPWAPKGVIIPLAARAAPGPGRPARDQVVYEVHVRGLTMQDPTVPEALRGTYAGAAHRARYLRELGVTAIELLPLHETPNDQNDLTPDASGDNYWGYSSLSYFAPDRRYAADRSPGGPTRELRAMVEAFHAEGIEVYVDVVYNHTTEGGATGDAATLLSWRGLDNATFYQLADDPRRYVNGNGVGPNVNVANAVTADLVVDSLRYWHEVIGVDGFRFDLMPISSNGCTRSCFVFAPHELPARIARALARPADGGPGALLIAEPWGLAAGSYQLGNFPEGWLEWNDRYRDTLRRDLNHLGRQEVTPRQLARALEGSPDLFGGANRASLNFVVAHDGFTLADLFRYDVKQNDQPWPYGPSDGGSDQNWSSSHGGHVPTQRTATRTALALLALSAGVPMITGGDEMLRTQRGNNNAYNLDSPGNWLDWSRLDAEAAFHRFTRQLFAFRHAHAALRPRTPWQTGADLDGDGMPQITWLTDWGAPAGASYIDDPGRHFLGFMLDADELGDDVAAILVLYNGWDQPLNVTLPAAPPGTRWRSAADTTPLGDAFGHFHEAPVPTGNPYALGPRGLALLVSADE